MSQLTLFSYSNLSFTFFAELCRFAGFVFYFAVFLPLGLEYLIEIQHNTLKKMPNNYCCLLCDADIKVKKDPVDTVDLAKNHLKSTGHKLKYLVSFLLLLDFLSF